MASTDAWRAALDEMVARTLVASAAEVKAAADELAKAAEADAPRRSGALASSIRVELRPGADGVTTAEVGPTGLAYARRMELGLHRSDARGRIYHQSGHGFFRKAEREVLPRFGDRIVDVWARAITG